MSESYRAICSDLYVNQKLGLKMDLPRERDRVLDLFERIRRKFPDLRHFRRYADELALESEPAEGASRWVGLRHDSIGSGSVNPERFPDAYDLHRLVLETAPYYLSLSPIDIDYFELLYGFDLAAERDHDAIVYQTLMAGSPFAQALELPDAAVSDCQPVIGFTLDDDPATEVHFEVRTRTRSGASERDAEGQQDPITVYVALRRSGPVRDIDELGDLVTLLAARGEMLCESHAVPHLVMPLRAAIASGRA